MIWCKTLYSVNFQALLNSPSKFCEWVGSWIQILSLDRNARFYSSEGYSIVYSHSMASSLSICSWVWLYFHFLPLERIRPRWMWTVEHASIWKDLMTGFLCSISAWSGRSLSENQRLSYCGSIVWEWARLRILSLSRCTGCQFWNQCTGLAFRSGRRKTSRVSECFISELWAYSSSCLIQKLPSSAASFVLSSARRAGRCLLLVEFDPSSSSSVNLFHSLLFKESSWMCVNSEY